MTGPTRGRTAIGPVGVGARIPGLSSNVGDRHGAGLPPEKRKGHAGMTQGTGHQGRPVVADHATWHLDLHHVP